MLMLPFAPRRTLAFRGLPLLAAWMVSLAAPADLLAAGRTLVVAPLHPRAADENPGSADRPLATIARAASLVRAGDTVLLEDGVYRETVIVEASGTKERPIVFAAASGAKVVVSGADVLDQWQKAPGENEIVSAAWPHAFLGWSPTGAHPDDEQHRLIGRCEQVFVDGYPQLQVGSRQELSPGTFFVDLEAKRLYLWDRMNLNPAEGRRHVQASSRQTLWESRGDHIQVRGVCFRHAANAAQQGAVLLAGKFGLLEDCVIEQTNGVGVSFSGDDCAARRCLFQDNGQLGFGAKAANLHIADCVCRNNNLKNFSRDWEAGGNKLVLCRAAVIERSVFRDNRGHGLWFDIGNEDCTVRNCLIADNEDAGLFYEISYRLHAHDNVIVGNGLAPRQSTWGASGGVSLSSSAGCRIERNLIVANKEGLQFREQPRQTPRLGHGDKQFAIWNRDHVIDHNLIAFNRDIQTAGWFDHPEPSHWRKPGAAPSPAPSAAPPSPASLDSLLERPAGLTLADLRLDLHDNLYAAKPGQLLWQWGCPWATHKKLASLGDVQKQLGLETASRLVRPQFADWITLDLRIPADSPLAASGCYPRGEVPGVRLGIMP